MLGSKELFIDGAAREIAMSEPTRRSVGKTIGTACAALMAVLAFATAAVSAAPPAIFAEFFYSPTEPTVGDQVTFTSTSTVPAGATIAREDWDFDGDGLYDAFGHSVTHTFTAPGTYTVTLRVQDSTGRFKKRSKLVTVTPPPPPPPPPADTTPPETTITGGPSGSTDSHSSTFAFASSESPATFECSLDSAAYSACSSPFTTNALSDGDHTFAVRAIDASANVDPTPATRNFTVITPSLPPPPPATTNSAPAAAIAPAPVPTTTVGPTAVTASSVGTFNKPVPAPTRPITPTPIVRILGSYSRLGVRLRLFTITAPRGVTVSVRCQGPGCPFRQRGPFKMLLPNTRPAGSSRYLTVRGFRGRLLKPGARIEVVITRDDRIGKRTTFAIRRNRPPQRTDGCVLSDGSESSCA